MADALISVLLEQLASITYEEIKGKVRLVLDVENQVAEFTSNLKAIRALLVDAEKREVKEFAVRDWLNKLKEVSYEMDNVLDEWKTEFLKQQVEKQENEGENILVTKRKVRFSIPSPSNCFCFGQVIRVVVCHDIARKIKELNSRLISIANERQHYQFQSTTSGIEEPQRPQTSSLVDVSKIFGRKHEKHTLERMLLGHSSTDEEERGPLVIPVVGMSGMGKTTLAQLVYNDKNVRAHFEKSIWVCVSKPFDQIKIAKAIIGDVDTPIPEELDALMQFVSESVKGKRFLLVLDDVWTEDDTKWEQLKLAFRSGAKGSRILVTTRKETVARMMEATTYMIHLDSLSYQNCLSLFYHIAFLDREKDETDLFEAIGNKIVKKCNGLPLAAKTLGSLMRYKNTAKEWRNVLDSEIWELEAVEKKVFQPLLLSYYDLTSEIKRCLLFCASFPKDYQINKDNLIELWMSQNYLNSKRNKEKREIGQQYFDDLIMMSFFQQYGSGNLLYKMHDIVHDFLQFLTGNECFIIKDQTTVLSSDSVHHLTLMSTAEGPLSIPTSFHTCKKLRSLTIFRKGVTSFTTIDRDLVLQLKCLRALNMREINIKEVPKEIGELLHLRYIDLSWNCDLEKLPDAMCNLCNLETLHLEWCRSLEKLPKAMGKLINLKHLYIHGCDKLSCLPKGLGRLTGLQILDKCTVVCGDNDTEKFKLGDLRIFDQLQGKLVIDNLGELKDSSEAKKAQLEKKEHLLDLALYFGGEIENKVRKRMYCGDETEKPRRKSDVVVLNALQPHQNLEKLSIHNFEGNTLSPKWLMSLHHLRFLTLGEIKYCESLPPLGKLQSLEVLEIDLMNLKKVGREFLGIEATQTSSSLVTAFPKLKNLLFTRTEGWEEWEGVGGCMEDYDCRITIMPYLSDLHIESTSLKQLPDFLQNRPQLNLSLDRGDWKRKAIKEKEKVETLRRIREHAMVIREAVLFKESMPI